jgi:hypothetical protein
MNNATGNGRKLDRASAISLGLAVIMSGGAATFSFRVPTTSDMKVIVQEAIDPMQASLHALDVRLTRIEAQLKMQNPGGG